MVRQLARFEAMHHSVDADSWSPGPTIKQIASIASKRNSASSTDESMLPSIHPEPSIDIRSIESKARDEHIIARASVERKPPPTRVDVNMAKATIARSTTQEMTLDGWQRKNEEPPSGGKDADAINMPSNPADAPSPSLRAKYARSPTSSPKEDKRKIKRLKRE